MVNGFTTTRPAAIPLTRRYAVGRFYDETFRTKRKNENNSSCGGRGVFRKKRLARIFTGFRAIFTSFRVHGATRSDLGRVCLPRAKPQRHPNPGRADPAAGASMHDRRVGAGDRGENREVNGVRTATAVCGSERVGCAQRGLPRFYVYIILTGNSIITV